MEIQDLSEEKQERADETQAGDSESQVFELESALPATSDRPNQPWIGPLILVPMGLVGAALALYLLFQWMMGEPPRPEDYLQEIVSGGYNARKQAFYELVITLQSMDEDGKLGELPADFDDKLAKAFDDLDSNQIAQRTWLAMCLTQLKSSLAFERVEQLVRDGLKAGGEIPATTPLEALGVVQVEHSNPVTNGLQLLGQLADPRAEALLLEQLQSNDAGARMVSARSLGAINTENSRAGLREALKDGNREVRRNAALALARQKDPAGTAVLLEMLDPATYNPETDPLTRDHTIAYTLLGLRELQAEEARPFVERLTENSEVSPRVVSEALKWLRDQEAGWPQ